MACGQSSPVQELEQTLVKFREALISGKKEMLSPLVMDELSYGHSGGLIENKEEFIRKLASGQSDFVTIDISNQTITISGNTAIVRHRLDASINDGGKAGEVHLLVLLVWQRVDDQWKLLARQAVKAS